jgi:hypothetical protein
MSELKSNIISKSDNIPNQYQGQDNCLWLLAIFFWSIIGHAILIFQVMQIVKRGAIFTRLDIVYWITVLAMIAVRYCDIRYFRGITLMGQPAAMRNWKKYVMYLIIISAAAWILSHLLSFLNR